MPEVTTDELEQQRQRIEEALLRQRNFFDTNQAAQGLSGFYNDPMAQGLFGQVQDRASGAASPFSPELIASLIANSTGANARGVQRDSSMIRRSFANSGLSGSGLENTALVNSRRQATAQNTAARRDITSRAELANFQARERAQSQVQQILQQRLQHQQQLVESQRNQANQATNNEINYRSQFREITPQQNALGQASQGNWVDRWNAAQVDGLTRRANGMAFDQSIMLPAQLQQNMAYGQQRLNQLLSGYQ